jgi:hypothetical protein
MMQKPAADKNKLITKPDDQVLDYIEYQHQKMKPRIEQCRDNPALSA